MDILKIVKKQFQKFGLSEKSLKEIANLVEKTLSGNEELTEEQVTEQVKTFEPIAKSFQSEVERRVSEAKKGTNGSNGSDDESEEQGGSAGGEKGGNSNEMLKQILNRLDGIEKGQAVKTNNQTAIAKLKELKLTESEIESVMYGRNFETAEQVEEFITKQTEIYETITAERLKNNAGNGFNPMSASGNYSKQEIQQDVEDFNKQF